MASELLTNNAASVLTAAITSGATTLTVSSASAFPTTGNFRILVDGEIMLVTAVSSNTFTVTRALESTTAAAHAANATVAHIITAGGLKQIILENNNYFIYSYFGGL